MSRASLFPPPRGTPRGFTLLEILLVLVILAVMAAMVAPSLFSLAGPSLQDEGRRLAEALRLALDEAALTGRPMRWTARPHHYVFETLDAEHAWRALGEKPFAAYALPQGMMILRVTPSHAPLQQDAAGDQEPILAHLLLPPQGLMEAAEITLALESDPNVTVRIQLRPGPGGVRIAQGEQQ